MSVLQYLKLYGPDESSNSSEDEGFQGFCDHEQRVDESGFEAFKAAVNGEIVPNVTPPGSWRSFSRAVLNETTGEALNSHTNHKASSNAKLPECGGAKITRKEPSNVAERLSEYGVGSFENISTLKEPTEDIWNDPIDSDGSFFDAEETSATMKRTKKAIQKEDSAKKRRMSHGI